MKNSKQDSNVVIEKENIKQAIENLNSYYLLMTPITKLEVKAMESLYSNKNNELYGNLL